MKNELQHVETVTAWSLSEKQIASYFLKIIYWYNENKLLGLIFFENKILVKLDVVFDSQSNDCNFSFLAPPGREKKKFQFFLQMKIFFFSRKGGARELKLQPFDSKSKTTSGCSYSLFSKKITPYIFFHCTIEKFYNKKPRF